MITMASNTTKATTTVAHNGEPYHPPNAAVPAAASAASLMLVLGAIVLWYFLMRRQLLRKKDKIPGRFGSHRSHGNGSFISNSFRDSSRHGSMKERALMGKSSRNSSLNKKSNGHAHRHSKCTCNCGDSPLLKKHSPRNSRNSLCDHGSCPGNSPFCPHTRRYLYQASVMRDSMDSDYYADDDATHSGGTSDNNICTCGTVHPPQKDRTSKRSLPDTTVVTIEHNNNPPSQMSPEKTRRYQSKARGVKLQAIKRLQLSQPYSYDMCMCELPSTSNNMQTMCMCGTSHGSLNGPQTRALSASAPNLADLQGKEGDGSARA
ncbi:uncharacterized protein [Amphiura filiformis]|uniref:uncharacterized protein n=1 Tax=Amphiura filiformis TaxID=82378 RepID=UPI003B21E29D